MNAVTNSSPTLIEENAAGSGSDTSPDESPEYYQPISDQYEDEDFSDQNSDDEDDHHHHNFHRLPNGYVENGISSLDLSDDDEEEEDAFDSEIVRAFREDERRRNAPLAPENAMRVMEAMRGISFTGVAPDWANRVPEDRWIRQVTRLRTPHPPPSTTAIQNSPNT